jgi:hypothetical protein
MALTLDGSAGVTTNAGGSVNPSTNIDGINYSCRAWVNFNGTGTVAIRASGNVSSITDNGTGDYTVNFTNAMPDANYAVNGLTNSPSGLDSFVMEINRTTTQTASLVRIRTFRSTTGVVNDPDIICVSIFR